MRIRARAAEHRVAVIKHRQYGEAAADAGQETASVEGDEQPLGSGREMMIATHANRVGKKEAPNASRMIDAIASRPHQITDIEGRSRWQGCRG
jgi:hypothetical protein